MKRAFLRVLLGQRASIKQRWRAVLQAAPIHTPLANPDVLAHLIDDTLEELFWGVLYQRAGSVGNEEGDTKYLVEMGSRCGLNPYVGYFLAGEAALVGEIKTLKPTAQLSENEILLAESELLRAFRMMSHREVNAFCEICRIERPAERCGQDHALPDVCPHKRTDAAKNALFSN